MRANHELSSVSVSFDETNLVPNAGLLPAARFRAPCGAAGVPVIQLHDTRHTSVTLMLNAGVPLHVVAAWHGHDPMQALTVYGHAQPDWLTSAGAALAL